MTAPGLSEQELAEIDAAVAKIEGQPNPQVGVFYCPPLSFTWFGADGSIVPYSGCVIDVPGSICGYGTGIMQTVQPYQPTRDPAEAMRLLVRHGLRIWPEGSPNVTRWGAMPSLLPFRESSKSTGYGDTPMIAIAHCVIALGAPK